MNEKEWVLDQPELTEIVTHVLGGQNEISLEELLTLVPAAEDDPDLLDNLMYELSGVGVSVAEPKGEDVSEPEAAVPAVDDPDIDHLRPDDLLSVYLAEMSQEPLLSHEDEIRLSQQIELGRHAARALKETDYTAQEYERLHAQVEAGQTARERLGRANTRLVVSIAKRYRGFGIPFTDLIQDGNVGLMRAVDRYDHRTGNRFSTYATWWIRQAVTRSLANQGRVIRIPVHMGGRMREMSQVAQRLEMETGLTPTAEEIAVEMNETASKVRQMITWSSRPLSLDQPMSDDSELELGDFIQDESAQEPDQLTDTRLLNTAIESLLGKLTAREARVLRLRYGLQDGEAHTLHEVAAKFGLSRERIRQIEREALAKIRLFARDYRLSHFLDIAS